MRSAPAGAAVRAGAFCLLTFALAACAKGPAPAVPLGPSDPVQQLRQDIVEATRAPGVRRASWGIAVLSLDRNEPVFELNAATLLVPASTAKLVSLAGAVQAVGWDFRFRTNVLATGDVVEGVVYGDLLVVGSGDPSIGGRGGTDLGAWVAALKARGVRRIDGRVIGDDDELEEPRPRLAWAWDDLGYPSGTLFGALNFAENRLDVTVSPAAAAGAPSTLTAAPGAARALRNLTVTGAPGSMQLLWPEQRPGEPWLTIAGSIPAGAPPARLAISAGNPTLWFAHALRHALVAGGIDVSGEALDVDDVTPRPIRDGSIVLYTHQSPTLAEIAQPLLKDSINLYGEAALRLNVPDGTFPTNDSALEGLRANLERWGIPGDAWQIVDGSGLSRRNAVAPQALVAVLERMYDASGRSPWMAGLPVAGRDGTLMGRMQGTTAQDNVRAKTGTMSNIRSLAGYVRTRDGEALAFAILAAAFEGTGSAANDAIDRIAIRLADFSRHASRRRRSAAGSR